LRSRSRLRLLKWFPVRLLAQECRPAD
jgi:hypothetical protein